MPRSASRRRRLVEVAVVALAVLAHVDHARRRRRRGGAAVHARAHGAPRACRHRPAGCARGRDAWGLPSRLQLSPPSCRCHRRRLAIALRKTRSRPVSSLHAMAAAPAEHDKLAEVVEAGTAIARGLDLDETLQAVVEAAARVTGAAYCALGVLGPDRRISRFITTGLTDEQRERLGSLADGPRHPRRADRRGAAAAAAQPLGRPALGRASRPTIRRCARSWACRSRAAAASSATST